MELQEQRRLWKSARAERCCAPSPRSAAAVSLGPPTHSRAESCSRACGRPGAPPCATCPGPRSKLMASEPLARRCGWRQGTRASLQPPALSSLPVLQNHSVTRPVFTDPFFVPDMGLRTFSIRTHLTGTPQCPKEGAHEERWKSLQCLRPRPARSKAVTAGSE